MRTLRPHRLRSLEETFDPKLNALNLVRLLLAAGVLLRHSLAMLGESAPLYPLETIMRSAFVDGFFAISGYLIVNSWMRRPDWRSYLWARCLRILPAFWVCLLLTALVISPIYAAMTGHRFTSAFWTDTFGYIWRNWFLWMFQEGIDGTPTGAAGAALNGVWNGSLWTLAWEFICYIAVMVLGLLGLMGRKWLIVTLFALSLFALIVLKPAFPEFYLLHHAARFATMFLAGALVYLYRSRIPAAGWLVVVMAAIVFVAGWLPDYRLVAALPLAYVCIVGGALVKVPALRLQNDMSYGTYIYGYPAQQMLVGMGLMSAGWLGFFALSVLATLPLAAASWFLIEKPAQRFRHRFSNRGISAPVTPVVPATLVPERTEGAST